MTPTSLDGADLAQGFNTSRSSKSSQVTLAKVNEAATDTHQCILNARFSTSPFITSCLSAICRFVESSQEDKYGEFLLISYVLTESLQQAVAYLTLTLLLDLEA